MPIGNIVKTEAKKRLTKLLGQYSPYAFNLIGGPLDQIASKLDQTEAQVLSKVPGALEQLGGVVFEPSREAVARTGSLGRGSLFQVVGAISADGSEAIPAAYKISITSARAGGGCTVVAVMQDKTTFRVTGDWEPFLPLGAATQISNTVSQFFTGKALLSRFMTRRIWKGTSPVSITMNLIFETIEDSYRNVVLPTMRLMQMALPSKTTLTGKEGSIPLLAPPGPSPFKTKAEGSDSQQSTPDGTVLGFQEATSRGGDTIEIRIGNYMLFNSVIIKDVQPVFDTKLSVDGNPVRSEVSVTFETYEILTKESLDSGTDKVFVTAR